MLRLTVKTIHIVQTLIFISVAYGLAMALVGCRQSQYQAANAPVSVSKRPASLSECSNGGTVLTVGGVATVACNGANGANGADGVSIVGPRGPAGTPGTVIAFVQFCPGTAVYPSVFPELGMCIDNKLYAVYSANNGMLVLVPPGAYQSNSIGSTCNFTVKPNCVITH